MRLVRLIVSGLLVLVFPVSFPSAHEIGELYRPGDEAVWVFEQDGQRIGEHWFRYEGKVALPEGSAHRFSGGVRIAPVPALPVEQRYQAELWVDGEGRPLRHVLHAQLGESYSRVELTFSESRADAHVIQGPSEQDLQVKLDGPVYVQANNFIGYFELMLGLAPPERESSSSYTLLSSNALKVIPYRATWKEQFSREIEGVSVKGSVFADSLGEAISLADDGRLLELSVPAQKLVVRRTDERLEPFTIEPPQPVSTGDRFDTEEVEIIHHGVTLAGSITRPKGTSGRLPAVFFISGSGLQDRQGVASGIDVGTHEILDRLTEEGFLVLRVDDRGVGGSSGPTDNLSYEDLVADARACVDFLFRREDVDPERVALVGHSEGGITAPILAAERPQIAAVVLMAASGRPLVDLIMDQNARALEKAGVTGKERDRKLAEVRRYLEMVSGDESFDASKLPAEFASLLAHREWLRGHAAVIAARERQAARVPGADRSRGQGLPGVSRQGRPRTGGGPQGGPPPRLHAEGLPRPRPPVQEGGGRRVRSLAVLHEAPRGYRVPRCSQPLVVGAFETGDGVAGADAGILLKARRLAPSPVDPVLPPGVYSREV